MKILIHFILLLILNQIPLFGQGLSDIPPFYINNPKWQYYTYDYFFPLNPRTLDDTPYSNRNYAKTLEKDEYFYILEHTATSIIGYVGWDGFRLTKLNKHTGKEEWVHQHNQHTGIKNFERPSPYIGFTSNGNIEILTLRHRDTTIKNNPDWFTFIGTPAIHTIDHKTGSKLNFRYGLDTTLFDHARFTKGGARLHRKEEGKYFSLLYRSIYNNGNSKDFFEFNKVDDSLNIEHIPSTLQELNPEYSESYSPWTNYIYNKDTMVILTGLEDKNQYSNSPSKAFLHWYNIKNLDSIFVLKTVEVTDAFARPQNNVFKFAPELIFKSGHVFLTQNMAPNSRLPFKFFTWLWWSDKKGNVLGEIKYVINQDSFYADVIPIGFKYDKAYFLANYYATIDDPIERWDVITIEPYSNLVTKIGQFLSYNHLNSTFRIFIRNADFLDNGTIVVESNILHKKNDLEFWYAHICSVDENSLGITTSSIDTDLIPSWSWVYPNPTADRLFIQLEESYSVEVQIRDITGKIIKQQRYDSVTEVDLDMNELASGMYYVTVREVDGRLPVMMHKVVRL
jgi:hypothetical protein